MNKFLGRFWPLLALVGFILFPVEWLADMWPPLDDVMLFFFPTAESHWKGHFLIFFLLGLTTLKMFPNLRFRPYLYLDLLLVAGIGEEAFQAVWRQNPIWVDTCGDLLTDLVGALLALGIMRLWYWNRNRRKARGITVKSGLKVLEQEAATVKVSSVRN